MKLSDIVWEVARQYKGNSSEVDNKLADAFDLLAELIHTEELKEVVGDASFQDDVQRGA